MTVPLRWIVLIGCFIAYLFDALEIVILSLALPSMRPDLAISVPQGGLLATATLLGIGVSAITAGWFSDRYGRKKPLIHCLTVFGTLSASLAFASNYELILAIRFLSGFGLGGVWAIVAAYVVETWPAQYRGRAVAFVLSAFPLGGALAAVIATLVLPSWRMMFFIAGAGVIIPILIVLLGFKESQEWLRTRQAGDTEVSATPVSQIFSREYLRVTLLGTAVCAFSLVAWWGASTWLPTFLHEDKNVPMPTVALFMTVLSLGMFLGYNVFGVIADKIGRKKAIIISLTGTGLLLPLYAIAASESTLLWLGPAFAFFAAFTGLFGSYLGELFPAHIRATGAGFCFNVGRGISALAPLILGSLAATVGFSSGFVVCGCFFLVAAVLMMALPSTDTREPSRQAPSPAKPPIHSR
ncbi:MFS transporter [Rhodococcus sp. WB9]|uniref:MFS transporter n=1 Tax=Rhodococcus sp. WB9 TaxID=2594007 RepID=UPI001186A393|nr:MFS transporter [Rhodococcus sp. WB9]QDQ95371.1 MFS transporter [Rhodococcus sp. WB9]